MILRGPALSRTPTRHEAQAGAREPVLPRSGRRTCRHSGVARKMSMYAGAWSPSMRYTPHLRHWTRDRRSPGCRLPVHGQARVWHHI